ncbi:hypothetical protein M752DRAFT_272074 [Aspergillus phoenicis ATCC 13157]|uniref:Uncharacterized protein n=2 Tax=Aspergillus TaxID=5052 RepID=A0A370Q121_ASPPH|nr:hypothetical protein M747DRAFT_296654 [Aspergillus niger ATCC 13496]RDK47834.1 hypothetical protein M752DRAFT_272074 [Aspergillus phoenicis ATCC 13157]
MPGGCGRQVAESFFYPWETLSQHEMMRLKEYILDFDVATGRNHKRVSELRRYG